MSEYANPTKPESDDEKVSLFTTLRSQVKQDWADNSAWYKQAEIDYGFFAGGEGQYESGEITKMQNERKPYASFNFIMPSVNAVIGMEVSNRQEVTFLPRTTQTQQAPQQQPQGGMGEQPQPGLGAMAGQLPGGVAGGMAGTGTPSPAAISGADDQGPAEMFTAAYKYFNDQCNGEDEVSDAFQDNAICGMGWTETRIGFDDNPDGEMCKDRIDPLEMGWDSKATKRNLVDSRRRHRVRQVDKRTAETMFPGYECGDIDAAWAKTPRTDQPVDRDEAKEYRGDDHNYDDGSSITICEVTWIEYDTSYKVANMATGEVVKDLDGDALTQLKKRLNAGGVPQDQVKIVKSTKRKYLYAFLGREEILDPSRTKKDDRRAPHDKGTECQSQKGWKFQCMTGTRDRNKRQWLGIVRTMRDPQKWANVLYSSSLHTLSTSGKGIIAERGAFENDQEAQLSWAKQDMITWAKPGAISGPQAKIMNKQATPLPPGAVEMMEFAVQAMRGVSGVNLEMLGGVDREQAASLEYQRRQAATTILAPFFDGLRRYRKDDGTVALDLIKNHLSDGRLIRITGPDYEKYAPLLRDEQTIEYDIIVAESPSSPNQKEAVWMMLQQMLPVLMKQQLGPKATAALLKASPLPETVVDDFADAAEADQKAAASAPPPPEVMLVQAQIEKVGADIKKTEADTALKAVELQQKQVETATQAQVAQIDAQDRQSERQHKQWMMGADRETKQVEFAAKQQEREANMKAKQIDAGGNPDMDAKFDVLVDAISQLAQGLMQSQQQLNESIGQLAQLVSSERVAEVQDPMTGEMLRAVSRLQTTMQ